MGPGPSRPISLTPRPPLGAFKNIPGQNCQELFFEDRARRNRSRRGAPPRRAAAPRRSARDLPAAIPRPEQDKIAGLVRAPVAPRVVPQSMWARRAWGRGHRLHPPQRSGRSRSRWSSMPIIGRRLSPAQSRRINSLSAEWGFGRRTGVTVMPSRSAACPSSRACRWTGGMMAAAALMMVPPVVPLIFVQRHLVVWSRQGVAGPGTPR